jgi:hypothetical protein
MSGFKTTFIAFAGQSIKQSQPVFEIQDGYECWDLKKFTIDEFVDALKKKMPPINNNVLRNYKVSAEEVKGDIYGITEKHYQDCSWGLLIPEGLESAVVDSYSEIRFLLNLFSPTFLYPLFYATNFGITRQTHGRAIFEFAHFQNQSDIFKTKGFVSFFKVLLPQGQYGTWQLDRIQKWNDEDWRLFVAGWFYSGLREYDNSKNSFGWQRESADMASILEALFTAEDSQNEEVGYRLRKRMAALLFWKLPTIEEDIKELYSQRSAFVHGSFFAQIAKDSKHSYNNLPTPDFNLLYKQKEYVRLALASYFHLAKLIQEKPTEFKNCKTVISALEQAVIDVELREKLIMEISTLFSFMPEPNFKMF